MDSPKYFYHATSPDNERLIKENNCLIPQKHKHSKWECLIEDCSGPELVPDGVWFNATLKDGDVPSFSPYGTRQVTIPIKSVIQQLGGNIRLYAGIAVSSERGNTYKKLMLVKGDETFSILQKMEKLDISDNPWLTLTEECKVARQPNWVDVYVPYPIDVGICSWRWVSTWWDAYMCRTQSMSVSVAGVGSRPGGTHKEKTSLREKPTHLSQTLDFV